MAYGHETIPLRLTEPGDTHWRDIQKACEIKLHFPWTSLNSRLTRSFDLLCDFIHFSSLKASRQQHHHNIELMLKEIWNLARIYVCSTTHNVLELFCIIRYIKTVLSYYISQTLGISLHTCQLRFILISCIVMIMYNTLTFQMFALNNGEISQEVPPRDRIWSPLY